MKDRITNSKRLNILGNRDLSTNRDAFAAWLTSWRKKLGYFSIFAALPAVFASQAQDALAEDVEKPQLDVAERTARFTDRLKSCNTKPDFLRRQSNFRLPHQKGSFDILSVLGGNDDCPGRTIPAGTYTAAAPYTDSGDTTGANNTVNGIYCYYCGYSNFSTPGPDHVYTFRVTATGPNPQIQVTATSAGYDPAIYVLFGYGSASQCPTGTNNFSYSALYYNHTAGGTETIQLNLYPFWFGAPLHLFVDSNSIGANGSGSYTLRMQDVTISPVVLSAKPRFDFDGDGRADISVFRPSDRTWYLNRSLQGFSALPYGLSTDKIVPLNFSGDRRTDLAVFRDGIWWLLYNFYDSYYGGPVVQFGLPNDIPVPADYSGDGRDELAVYRNGTWLMRDPFNNQISSVQFGLAGDKPVPADYDGDGKTDFAVFRPSDRTWYIANSSNGSFTILAFGLATDKPVPADYDGDGKTDLAVYRDGTWHILGSTQGYFAFQWGLATDIPAPDDYDGDGKTDAAVYRNGTWWILQSTSGVAVQQFGLANDKPIPAAYLPQ
jgi:hypothetical protein